MPKNCSKYLFSAKRYYEIFKPKSIEGNLFNYNKKLDSLKKIKCPILAIFGKDEQSAVIKPQQMLEKIKLSSKNKNSEVFLTKGDHGFRGGEKELIKKVSDWIKKMD